MKILIVYVHPYEKSYSHAVLERVIGILESKNRRYEVIDLYADEFQATYSKKELSLYQHGESIDTKVLTYQSLLKESSSIIFITPIWWNDVPAMLKGFFDKVFTKPFAYIDGNRGVTGKLNHIQSAIVLTSSNSPTWFLKWFCGNPIKKIVLNATFKQVGIKNGKWLNLGQIKKANHTQFLADLALVIENIN